ncbi:hypothetical protein ATCC90586_007275 [Pythium insidiosum]|nr:hypothetical protein ATCC90586_007275 [Pythium insidiosum]
MATPPPSNSVGWYILEGYPWWPVYICDQYKLRPNLHILGDGHRKILKKAKDFPKHYAIVYYFGSHDFSLVSLKKGVLKPWDCSERESFLKGHPHHLVKKKLAMEELQFAIQEAEDFLSQPDDIRLPPHMVPSDLDPSLEPPPPMERPEEAEDDAAEDDGDADMGSDGEAENDDEDDEDADMDESDSEKKKKAKKKKSKESKSKKASKDSKEKSSKSKKSSSSKDKDKDKKKKPAKKSKDVDAQESNDAEKKTLKRRRSEESEPTAEKSPAKQVKKEEATAVKTENPTTPSVQAGEGDEDLSIVLEKEIRWILLNCKFEEMTTKTVRKMLEKRLNRDLRHHKAAIRAGVDRVISSIEDEEGGEATDEPQGNTGDVKTEVPVDNVESIEIAAKEQKTVPAEEIPVENTKEDVKAEENDAPAVKAEVASESSLDMLKEARTQLTLAGDDEQKVLKVLASLESVASVDPSELAESGLLAKLVELRARRQQSIEAIVSDIAKRWDVEGDIPAPKTVKEEDLIEMKNKIMDADTPHDELLACLNELEKLPLEISHLKNTGISRVVAKLRQHANDKVSIQAKNLRNAWMQLVDKSKNDNNHDQLRKLEHMNNILETETDADTQLGVLESLYKMSLSTREIIDSKIGVIVSKLRKSSHENVAHAAAKLRKKWKSEAGAA